MTISLFGIENVKEHNFKVEIGNKIIKFWIDSEEVQLKNDCQAIIHQLYDYCNEENDKTFTQRTFFKAFLFTSPPPSCTEIHRSLCKPRSV